MKLAPVHFSDLKRIAQSPAHYRHGLDVGFRSTRPQDIGTLIHALVLGGDTIVYDGKRAGAEWTAYKALVDGAPHFIYDGKRSGKAWTAAKDAAAGAKIVSSADVERAEPGRALQAARRAAGKHDSPIVTSAEHDTAKRCADAVTYDPIVRDLGLLQGEREASLAWKWLGRDCEGRLDVLDTRDRQITELKMSAKAEPEWFQRQALRLGYHQQLPWYADGVQSLGFKIDRCFIIAVEPKPPFALTVFEATEAVLELGRKTTRLWMERLLGCEAADEWPAYSQCVVPFDAPEVFELNFGDGDEEDEAA